MSSTSLELQTFDAGIASVLSKLSDFTGPEGLWFFKSPFFTLLLCSSHPPFSQRMTWSDAEIGNLFCSSCKEMMIIDITVLIGKVFL